MANILAVDPHVVSEWESAEKEPSIILASTIADLFEIPLDDLLGRTVEGIKPRATNCYTCPHFERLLTPRKLIDGNATIYGYCYVNAEDEQSDEWGTGFPIFQPIVIGERCESYVERRENMNTQTQCDKVLAYIKKHGKISTIEAFTQLHITRLSGRIYDLKQKGYEFITIERSKKDKDGQIKRWVDYVLKNPTPQTETRKGA